LAPPSSLLRRTGPRRNPDTSFRAPSAPSLAALPVSARAARAPAWPAPDPAVARTDDCTSLPHPSKRARTPDRQPVPLETLPPPVHTRNCAEGAPLEGKTPEPPARRNWERRSTRAPPHAAVRNRPWRHPAARER